MWRLVNHKYIYNVITSGGSKMRSLKFCDIYIKNHLYIKILHFNITSDSELKYYVLILRQIAS